MKKIGVIFVCDGCGNQEAGIYVGHNWHKPALWFERADEDGAQIACSRECIDKISKKTGKTSVVLPV